MLIPGHPATEPCSMHQFSAVSIVFFRQYMHIVPIIPLRADCLETGREGGRGGRGCGVAAGALSGGALTPGSTVVSGRFDALCCKTSTNRSHHSPNPRLMRSLLIPAIEKATYVYMYVNFLNFNRLSLFPSHDGKCWVTNISLVSCTVYLSRPTLKILLMCLLTCCCLDRSNHMIGFQHNLLDFASQLRCCAGYLRSSTKHNGHKHC